MSDENIPSNKIEARVLNVEQAIRLLTELSLRGYERIDAFEEAMNNLAVKMEALADAQIQTEDKLSRLTESQAHSDQRLDALINFIDERLNKKP